MKCDRILEIILVLLILILSAYLRLENVTDNPGWYSDEGTIIEIADNLSQGQVQYLAINRSFLLFARLPVFPVILAGLFKIFGMGIKTLRVFTGCLGVVSVGLLYVVIRNMLSEKGKALAVLSAAMLAIYPSAILYNRLGFSYNLLTPLILLTFWGLWNYLDSGKFKWLLLAASAIGIGCISDLMMFTIVPVALLVIFTRSWRDAFWGAIIMGIPFAIYSITMLIIDPEAFIFDFQFTFTRLGELSLIEQIPSVLFNYYGLLENNNWILLSIIGLFLLNPMRFKLLSIIQFLFPILLLSRTTFIGGTLGFYYLSPLFPFVALGIASLIIHAIPYFINCCYESVTRMIKRNFLLGENQFSNWIITRISVWGISIGIFVIIISPFLISSLSSLFCIKEGMHTPIDSVLVNPKNAREAIIFLNKNVNSEDVVIASPAIAWMINANVADFQMSIAAEGNKTIHLPSNIPMERFIFNPKYSNARFMIIDPIWRNWAAINMPEVASMMSKVKTWELRFISGDIIVFENPKYNKSVR